MPGQVAPGRSASALGNRRAAESCLGVAPGSRARDAPWRRFGGRFLGCQVAVNFCVLLSSFCLFLPQCAWW